MEATRAFWERAGIGVVLGVWGLLTAQRIGLIAAGVVGVYLLGRYVLAVRSFVATERTLRVAYDATRVQAMIDDAITFHLGVVRNRNGTVPVMVTAPTPPAAQSSDADARTVSLAPEDAEGATAFDLSFPVAGEVELPAPTVHITDSAGLFTTETTVTPIDEWPTVRISPRQPRNIHVGQAGEQFAAAYGEHAAGRGSAGLEPAELRQYQPGDSADRIDWKATARLDETYVREFEAETDQQTILLVDQSSAMDVGPTGETMLDYAREVALGYARGAESLGDPLGLYCVGDEGTTVEFDPRTGGPAYRRVRNHLHDLRATQGTRSTRQRPGTAAMTRPRDARRIGQQLSDDDSAFARSVAPYFTDQAAYLTRLTEQSLFGAMRHVREWVGGDRWTVLFTSDTDRNQVRETARLATQTSDHAIVFLTPTVLYEVGSLSNIEDAYARYVDFEEFRRELDRLPRVSAFELGPGDRLETLVAERREQLA